MEVLLLGGTSFIGRTIVEDLLARGVVSRRRIGLMQLQPLRRLAITAIEKFMIHAPRAKALDQVARDRLRGLAGINKDRHWLAHNPLVNQFGARDKRRRAPH